MARTDDITSFPDYRQNLRQHLSLVRESGWSLHVTTNGQPDAVVSSPESHEALADTAELAEILMQLERGGEDIREGRTRPAKSALKQIAAELDLKPDRSPRC